MSFQPVVPVGGMAGWAFLQRTYDTQKQAFDRTPQIERETQHFRDRIASVGSAAELVSDRRLLTVALGAFGLSEDIDARFFIRTVLEDGVQAEDALANRLSDRRYFDLARAFSFDRAPPATVDPGFGARIAAAYRERQFEAAIGARDPDLRLAVSLDRELGALAERGLGEDAAWFTVLATPPLRAVFERALGLPGTVGTLDIGRQLGLFRDKSRAVFGVAGPAQFAGGDRLEALRQRFLASADRIGGPALTGPGAIALALLGGGGGARRAV